MQSIRRLTIVAVAVPALALTACGSSSDKSLDQKALAAKADAICVSYNKQAKAIAQPKNINDPAQAAAYFQAAHDLAKKQRDELGGLKPADAVKTKWAAYLAAYDEGTTYFQQLADAAKAKDQAAGQKLLTGFQTLSTKINGAADAVGATTCGSKSS